MSRAWVVTRRNSVSDAPARFIVHNEFKEYVDDRIAELAAADAITTRVADRSRRVLGQLSKVPGIVFPHVGADEGEVNAIWLADQMSFELSIPSSGPIYARATRDGAESAVGFFDVLPQSTKSFLSVLSKTVEAANPRWREVFQS